MCLVPTHPTSNMANPACMTVFLGACVDPRKKHQHQSKESMRLTYLSSGIFSNVCQYCRRIVYNILRHTVHTVNLLHSS